MPIDWNIVDDDASIAPDQGESIEPDRLNATRIRTIVLERRAAHRRRLWMIGRAAVFLVSAFILLTASRAVALWPWGVLHLLAGLLLLWRGVVAYRAWRRCPGVLRTQETYRSPDFSTLDNGSAREAALQTLRPHSSVDASR